MQDKHAYKKCVRSLGYEFSPKEKSSLVYCTTPYNYYWIYNIPILYFPASDWHTFLLCQYPIFIKKLLSQRL